MLKRIFSKITKYAVASTNEAAFIIGGDNYSGQLDIIAKYSDHIWSLFGKLQTPRSSLVAITSGGLTMLIGGYDSNHTLVFESKPWISLCNHILFNSRIR